MMIQLHTPKGTIEVNPDTVTDKELVKLGITRQALSALIPVDLPHELEKLKERLTLLEGR